MVRGRDRKSLNLVGQDDCFSDLPHGCAGPWIFLQAAEGFFLGEAVLLHQIPLALSTTLREIELILVILAFMIRPAFSWYRRLVGHRGEDFHLALVKPVGVGSVAVDTPMTLSFTHMGTLSIKPTLLLGQFFSLYLGSFRTL
jgi:hypothetical protein